MPRAITWILYFFIFQISDLSLFGHELVDINSIDKQICVQLRNINYPPESKGYLVRQVAKQLSRVQKDLEKDCIGLVVLDAYRPYSYAQFFEIPFAFDPIDECNPIINGHYRGTAVDVTLVYMDGQSLEMPPFYDIYELQEKGTDYFGFSCQAYHNLQKLQKAMEKHRFIPSKTEWWHFDYKDWFQYEILDVSYLELLIKKK